MKAMLSYSWRGNVRELQNACERAVLLAQTNELLPEHFLLGAIQRDGQGETEELKLYSGLSVADAEKKLIFETLRVTGNNKTRAAELLGISIRTLRNKLNEYGVAGNEAGLE
jgi:two-component system response regulator FlrC